MSHNLARKYRPKSINDLVGQDSVVRIISNAFAAKKLHQAYLFVGMYGSGKTSMGRILAAMENCENGPTLTPDGTCSICRKIFDGVHPDIEEIDAASGAGKAEQVRKLKENAQYSPVDGCRTKYFIIDECHRLSETANDALLKLIEEPPPGIRFALCTTDVQKMRPAVESRCQRHDFKRIYWTQISERLIYVSKIENIQIEEEAANLCAKLSNGSMRTALQHLEKLFSYSGNGKITVDHAQEMFGTLSDVLLDDIIDQIVGVPDSSTADTSSGFKIINKMMQTGVDFNIIYEGLADHLRNIVVGLTASGASQFLTLSSEGKNRLKQQCVKCKQDKKLNALFSCFKNLNDAKMSVEYNISPEVALQQWFVESFIIFRS